MSLRKHHKKGLVIKPFFSDGELHPFDLIDWEKRDAVIFGKNKTKIFEQKDVHVPTFWSDQALGIVCSKYFKGTGQTRETGVDEMIKRVVDTLTSWGKKSGYFKTAKDAQNFNFDLCYLIMHQMMSFNSPVWFNIGVKKKPQTSACFILSVEDDMEHIGNNLITEIRIFKWGSGTGSNKSILRGSMESITEGGLASGPPSFIKISDKAADVVKSGGKMRRAAKIEILDSDHPDIFDFVNSKLQEEEKAQALISIGFTPGDAYSSVGLQNTNISVRVTDDFMKKVLSDEDWSTRLRLSGKEYKVFKAKELLDAISKACHFCGDPGIQFDTIINLYHTCKNSGRIRASNPCSEFMFLDGSACNLASLNLMRFQDAKGNFLIDSFKNAVRITLIAQDLLIDHSSFPTEEITKNSKTFRPLGLGYTNLGAFLISNGYAYGSDASVRLSGAITSLMTSTAYLVSSEMARELSPFDEFSKNVTPFFEVLNLHSSHSKDLETEIQNTLPEENITEIINCANENWTNLLANPNRTFRNAQVTLLAPTGTTSLMMDAETTGIEPPLDILVEKSLVGGGTLKLISTSYSLALEKFGYTSEEIKAVEEKLKAGLKIKDLHLKSPDHESLFLTALGEKLIPADDHIKMMSYVQRFLSGAISKTINLPNNTSTEEVFEIFVKSWKAGLKSISLYRDGSKKLQPLKGSISPEFQKPLIWGTRRRLPVNRQTLCHEFSVQGRKGFLHIGFFEDGSPGELFIRMAKEGSLTSGALDMAATAISFALQYGCPMEKLVDKFSWTRYEPSGITSNPQIKFANSIGDYIFRFLGLMFVKKPEPIVTNHEAQEMQSQEMQALSWDIQQQALQKLEKEAKQFQDSPTCGECEAQMRRSGNCFVCPNCGSTSGVCS